MSEDQSKYVTFQLHGLHPIVFGQTYLVITASIFKDGQWWAEYIILTTRPSPQWHKFRGKLATIESLEEGNPPSIDALLDAVRQHAELELERLLEQRSIELDKFELAYQKFELTQCKANPLLMCWQYNLFHPQIEQMAQWTLCPSLRLSLRLIRGASVLD